MGRCAPEGGCPSDYVAVIVAILSVVVLLARAILPFMVYKVPRAYCSGFWLLIVQVIASVNFLLSLVMSFNYLKFGHRQPWESCYLWAVWFEGPLGFGLLLCCRIVQAFQLYFLFVRRRLPPVKSYVLLTLIHFPWIGAAALSYTNAVDFKLENPFLHSTVLAGVFDSNMDSLGLSLCSYSYKETYVSPMPLEE